MLQVSQANIKVVAADFFDVNLTLFPTVSWSFPLNIGNIRIMVLFPHTLSVDWNNFDVPDNFLPAIRIRDELRNFIGGL